MSKCPAIKWCVKGCVIKHKTHPSIVGHMDIKTYTYFNN